MATHVVLKLRLTCERMITRSPTCKGSRTSLGMEEEQPSRNWAGRQTMMGEWKWMSSMLTIFTGRLANRTAETARRHKQQAVEEAASAFTSTRQRAGESEGALTEAARLHPRHRLAAERVACARRHRIESVNQRARIAARRRHAIGGAIAPMWLAWLGRISSVI